MQRPFFPPPLRFLYIGSAPPLRKLPTPTNQIEGNITSWYHQARSRTMERDDQEVQECKG
uniref:Uncharacterized protein n=1 Tax=Oryza nivara TaxID=4536 RepID=A0A0E0HYF3_ORYNI